ncbi:long-chain-fatty-acid--CoA ligase [Sphingomonas sp. 1P06PA]|uniref:long-chain-fatty-acid--CoA ligase n=1 Tax=Sphingomonas sp. 1P06PA TaxID=554121 RepID=UPI0039A63E2E
MPLRFARRTPEAYDYPLTIRHLLHAALTTAADREIIYRDTHRYTYAEMNRRLARLAGALAALGVREGATVAVMDWDSHRYLECYFAIPMMGAVLQTVNVRLSAEQIRYTLEHARAEVLIVNRDFLGLLAQIGPLPGLRAMILIDETGQGTDADFAGEYEALLASAEPFEFVDFDENAIATTFYTTGTTGDPKGVEFSHRQIVLQALAGNAPFGVTGDRGFGHGDVYMPLTPMFHVHAWGMPYIATMLGVTQVYPGRYEPELICRLRQEHGVSFSHCVPTILQMVLAEAGRTGADLAGWMMIIGGAAMTPALCAEARAHGMSVVSGYGMSETAPLITITRPCGDEPDEATAVETLCRAGVPVPLIDLRVVDGEMRDVPHDGVTQGEVVVRSPWLTQGYVGNDAASAELWRGGWLHTQDIGTIDADGYLVIRDRLKDVIKTGGEWLSSLALEALIAEHDAVAEVAVVGVPCPKWSERPLAVIVPSSGGSVDRDGVNGLLRHSVDSGAISKFALLDRIELVDALPRTSVGKIDKKALRARFG